MGNYLFGSNNNDNTLEEQIETLQNKVSYQDKVINDQEYLINILEKKNSLNGTNIDLDQLINTKTTKNYEYLVFSGGGIKGLSYCGALDILEKYGILYDNHGNTKIKGYAGTSAGSIAAALLAIGMNTSDLKQFINDMDFNKILDDKIGIIRDTYHLIEKYGICPGIYIETLIGDQVEKMLGNRDYTIQQLFDEKQITLVITSTDMNRERTIYFYPNSSNNIYSDIPIHKAVRMSMGIPFLFEPITFDNNYCVDGGVLDNYPIHVFDGEYPGDPNARLNICQANSKVLGLNIVTKKNVSGYDVVPRQQIDELTNYAISFVDTVMTENERRIITPANFIRTISIVTDDYPLSQFNLTDKQKMDLIEAGSKSTESYFINQ